MEIYLLSVPMTRHRMIVPRQRRIDSPEGFGTPETTLHTPPVIDEIAWPATWKGLVRQTEPR